MLTHLTVDTEINPVMPSLPANSVDPDQSSQSAASGQDLHCLHIGISIKIKMKMKKYTGYP